MNSYRVMDKMLKNKTCLYVLLAGELIIWLNNIIAGIYKLGIYVDLCAKVVARPMIKI